MLAFLCLVLQASADETPVRFAVVGDYGMDNSPELAVSQMVKTNFQPDFIITAGDNNYGAPSLIDRYIGKYYSDYIGNYKGAYGPGASTNRFFPVLGNHDWGTNGFNSYLDYFTLPDKERYYEFVRGPVHFFMLNSDTHELDGNTATSLQGGWLSNRLAQAGETWKVVVLHHPPYSSSEYASTSRWPFKQWGASIVISGHAHNYERLNVGGLDYIVNGLGGAAATGFNTIDPGSVFRFNAGYGAMLVVADAAQARFEFYTLNNPAPLDTLILANEQPRLFVAPAVGGGIRLSWSTNAVGFGLEACTSLGPSPSWSAVPGAPWVEGDRFVFIPAEPSPGTWYRLRR